MSPGDYILEEIVGIIDGFNRTFSTAFPYEENSLKVWLNGLLLRALDDDGWIEIDDTTFETREAPRVTDSLHVRYVQK